MASVDYSIDLCYIQGVSTHDAWLTGHIECAPPCNFLGFLFGVLTREVPDAVDLTVSGRILCLVC